MLAFPDIDPVIIHIGPLALRWYGLAYVVGILGGWRYALWLAKRFAPSITNRHIDDFAMWVLVGVIVGGRLGHVLFFDPARYLSNPWEIFMTWQGGMSFHGGLAGATIACFLYCRKKGISTLRFGDLMTSVAPIGLFLGRLANFINGELFGRVTDVPWAMVFPYGGPLPRHPSQLYEAFFEGLVLLIFLNISWRIAAIRNVPGRIAGIFFLGYGLARSLVELVREPDAVYVLLGADVTIGQLLSLPLILMGTYLILPKRGKDLKIQAFPPLKNKENQKQHGRLKKSAHQKGREMGALL